MSDLVINPPTTAAREKLLEKNIHELKESGGYHGNV